MSKKAVMYGGGNIGRGFIGMLFSQSGYRVSFVDVNPAVVSALQERGCYPVRILSGEDTRDVSVTNVTAIHGNDTDAVAQAIAQADIVATAVGVNILKFIVGNLAAGIRRRKEIGGGPLNIIICENLMDANKVLEGMLKEQLTESECAWFDKNIGLVEASIGRMVPVQTGAMQDGDPMRVCVEGYGFLPVDKAAFKGPVPEINSMVPFAPFDFYIKRKLYLHNMGHAVCAYLGDLHGLAYIYQAIDRDDIYVVVENAMLESAQALSARYGVPLPELLSHIQDLLERFRNEPLMDTCQRVGGDPTRKLSPADRLIGSASLALEQELCPAYICVGIAAGLWRYIREAGWEQSEADARRVLSRVSGISDRNPLMAMVLSFYELLLQGETIHGLHRAAAAMKRKQTGAVI